MRTLTKIRVLICPTLDYRLAIREQSTLAERFNQDAEIQALLSDIYADSGEMVPFSGAYSAEKASALKSHSFDRQALGARGLQYEQLDQLVVELLLGIR